MSRRLRICVFAIAIACASLVHADAAQPGASNAPAAGVEAPASASGTTQMSPPVADAPATPSSAAAASPTASRSAPARSASGALQLETTQITGNRELPKVMVIVPWKSAEPAELAGRPLNSLVEEVLTPIDRDVMRRTLDYYRLLAPGASPAADAKQAADIDTTNQ